MDGFQLKRISELMRVGEGNVRFICQKLTEFFLSDVR